MIALSSSQTETIADYRTKFSRPLGRILHTVSAQDLSLGVRVAIGLGDAKCFGVFDGDELVAVMQTYAPVEEVPYRHIRKIIVAASYRGNGIARQLIEWWVLSHQQCLASDEDQTYEGAGVWKSMIGNEPRLSFSLMWLDGREEPVKVEDGRITPDPWAEHHTRLLARP